MLKRINKIEFELKMAVILLACVTPILCLVLHGYSHSLSSYWETEMQPLFIVANITTAYYLSRTETWIPSAITLILLTAFSVEMYPNLHNFLAGIFFIVTLYPLWVTHHFKWCFWIYMIAIVVFPFNMLIAELIAIWALCLHQGLVLNKIYKLNRLK